MNFVTKFLKIYKMIIGDLKHSDRYEALHKDFKRIFDYIKSIDWSKVDLGKKEIDGEKLFVIHSNPDGLKKEEQVLEYHRKYLDIHILLEGKETIGWKSLDDCTQEKKTFDPTDDYGLYGDLPTTYVELQVGQFAIIYPEDAHAPIIGEGKIRKLVVKALV